MGDVVTVVVVDVASVVVGELDVLGAEVVVVEPPIDDDVVD